MKIKIIAAIVTVILWLEAGGQRYEISGKVLDDRDRSPVGYAAVTVPAHGLWAVAGIDGRFTVKGVPAGRVALVVSCTGRVKRTVELLVARDTAGIELLLAEENLLVDAVEVTAKSKRDDLTTSYTMGRSVLDHMQLLQLTDVASLLPGGITNRSVHLATAGGQRFALRGATGEMGNVTFGTAVEVDGVRLSTNPAFDGATGPDTRNISSSNIESIEVITGIPPVEHGDMTQGIVRVNTREGLSPFIVELSTKPHTKQVSVNKGFALGRRAGVLNASVEHARSISDPASPYTSYERNVLSLAYSLAGGGGRPARLTVGVTGSTGGYDSKADPDAFTGTYTRERDRALRGHVTVHWLPRKPWITAVEATVTANFADRLAESRSRQSGASSTVAVHGTGEGYFVGALYEDDPGAPVILIPPGYWYRLAITDSKPLSVAAKVNARWFHALAGGVDNTLLAGAEFTSTGNLGKGLYYDDLAYAPTWRAYPYDGVPFMHNLATYVEEGVALDRWRATAGLRADVTSARGGQYGRVGSLSPRLNVKYAPRLPAGAFLHDVTARLGWGKSVKLPSFSILYPAPSYTDRLAFAPGTTGDGTTFLAYHVMPEGALYNPRLRWQYSTRLEAGVEGKIGGATVSLVFFRGVTRHAYTTVTRFIPFAYKLTDQSALEGYPVASADRRYSIDPVTGVVTVSDKTGARPDGTLAYRERETFASRGMPENGSPSRRAGIEWVVEFGRVRALNTSVRWDGSYYTYKGVDDKISASISNGTLTMSDGRPYRYVGFYAGGAKASNGKMTRHLTSNVTFVTRVPAARLLFSLRVEASLYEYARNLCELSDGSPRGFVLADNSTYLPSTTETDVYGGDRHVGVYPLYYTTYEDMETRIPFAGAFARARESDPVLFNDLAKLVVYTNYPFIFNPDRVSASCAANIGVTKEIGDFASISFNATNATRNMGRVTSSYMDTESSLYDSRRVPAFYYGLSLRLKL
jgi:hypothetical protein